MLLKMLYPWFVSLTCSFSYNHHLTNFIKLYLKIRYLPLFWQQNKLHNFKLKKKSKKPPITSYCLFCQYFMSFKVLNVLCWFWQFYEVGNVETFIRREKVNYLTKQLGSGGIPGQAQFFWLADPESSAFSTITYMCWIQQSDCLENKFLSLKTA